MLDGFPLAHGTLYPCFVDAVPGSNVDNIFFDMKSFESKFSSIPAVVSISYSKDSFSIRFNSAMFAIVNGVLRFFVPGDVLTVRIK